MTVMRWFRKNNKKLMAFFVVALMVAFTIPSVLMRGCERRDSSKDIIAYYQLPSGEEVDINRGMLIAAERDLRILQGIGADAVSWANIISAQQQTGQQAWFSDLAIYLLTFPGSRYSQNIRSTLYQQAQQNRWLMDEVQSEAVMRIIGAEPNKANVYYMLLTEETRRAGIQVTPEEIDTFFKMHSAYRQQGLQVPGSIAALTNEFNISEQVIKQAVGNYLSLLQYGRTITDTLAVSEPQLKKAIRDMVEWDNIEGTYVSFEAGMYLEQIADPTVEQLQQHFDAYKDKMEGDFNEENEYGFGYKLPDRVQVEYLQIDLKQVKELVEQQFSQLSTSEQERQVEEYWAGNKDKFRIQLPPAEGEENAQPQYKDPEFGEIGIYAKAEMLLKRSLIQEEAEKILEKIKQQSQQYQPDEEQAHSNFAELAQQASTDKITVFRDQTEFLSYAASQNYLDFASVYKMIKGRPQQGMLEILFNCEPLYKGFSTRLEDPPTPLFREIGPMLPYEDGLETGSAYLVRILAADPAREPVSMQDDGKWGPAENIPADQESVLTKTIKRDWEKLQAYLLAKQKAQDFAAQAKSDWTAALTTVNESLITDPNQTAEDGPVQEKTLADVKQQLQFLQQYMQQQNAPNLYAAMYRNNQLIRESIKLANKQDKQDTLPILDSPENFNSIVFKDLQVTPPDEMEYLRRKPMVTQGLKQNNQQLLALTQFNPIHVEKRNGYRERLFDSNEKENE